MPLILLILVCVLVLFPLVMLMIASRIDRVMSGRLALASGFSHVVIILITWQLLTPYLTLGYLILANLLWIYALLFGGAFGRLLRRRIRKDDMAKYQRIIRQHPEHASAHSALADAYMEIRQYDLAIAAYEQAIRLDPDHSRLDRVKLNQAIALRDGPNANRGETVH